ncbi:MAG TPA: MFS transporter, partial [Ktedonobacterales bacterium]|nr:MFS transporter [Ktedonobacterales bacterium]
MTTQSTHDIQQHQASMPDTQPTQPTQVAALTGWAFMATIASLMVAQLLTALDQTIVATAEPHIIGDLQGFSRYTWVFTAYLLTSTTMIPLVSKFSDQFGRKGLLLASIGVFLAASALAGASQTMNQLIVFRGLQGLGAGATQALVTVIVADIFPPARRARWVGLFTGVYALASVIGPAVGGWLTDTATWRWVFYVNLPLGIVALVALVVWLPANLSVRSTQARGWAAIRRIDILGALLAAAATVCLLVGLSWGGQTYPWASAQVIGLLSGSGLLFIAFVVAERYAVEPVLPLDLFRNQVIAAASLLALTANMALFALVIYLPLYIQGVLGHSATSSGLTIIPLTFAVTIGAVVGGLIVSWLKRYQMVALAGAVVLTFGIFLMTRMTATT